MSPCPIRRWASPCLALVGAALITSCLDRDEWTDPLERGRNVTSRPAADPPEPNLENPVGPRAPIAAGPHGENARSCTASDCHASLRDRPSIHVTVATGACETCHEPAGDPGAHAFRPARAPRALCTRCHAKEAARQVVHGPYRESACLECHDPHGGPTRAHLRSEDDAGTCGRCHRRSPDAHDHAPHAAGECITCHEPHQSDHRGLLVESGNALCARCHADVSDRLSTLSRVHGPAAADCTLCHHPHGSGIDMLLHREPTSLCLTCHDAVRERIDLDPHVHGIIRTEDGCAGCHDPHASHTPGLLRAEAAKSCLECHGGDSPGTLAHSIRSGRFKHGPVVEGECYACHVPHSSRHPHLLRAAFPEEFYRDYSEEDYALCYGCHPPALVQVERTTTLTGFRDGDRNLHYVHVAGRLGRTCRACHEVHASDLPFHMRESVPYGPNDWELPINFEKTPTGGSCAPGCHLEMAYDNTRP